MKPTAIRCVAPSCLAVGERFALKVKVLGPVRKIECRGNFNDRKPALHGPFNLNVSRRIQYHDNCLPEWTGRLTVDGGPALFGPGAIVFDGVEQGVFPGDTRPIRVVPAGPFTAPGFHFVRLMDEESGVETVSNPVRVTEDAPELRIFWGDPHWQTFFSDGVRCPEELYAFARDEGFLDFGAISDHMEAITDRQWDYFQAVANDFDQPGRFVTLIGQEWTHHDPARGAPGHRNVYYSSNRGPALRSNDPDCDTLAKLWRRLDAVTDQGVLAIPHHTANVIMGVDWEQGWNPEYENAVEICSVWGSSEKHRDDGNIMPIEHCNGEMRGRHVVDALNRGFKFGFVGGGDIHDGRPGDQLHGESYPPRPGRFWPEGFTAALAPSLSRANVFDAMANRRTYATTQSRIYLDVTVHGDGDARRIAIEAASEEGIREAAIVLNGEDVELLRPDDDARVLIRDGAAVPLGTGDFGYVRVTTAAGNMAWFSPFWG